MTATTVGYGDVAPVTILGKMMASLIMLTGFSIIAVPTGIVTHAISREMLGRNCRRCKECGWDENDLLRIAAAAVLVGRRFARARLRECGRERDRRDHRAGVGIRFLTRVDGAGLEARAHVGPRPARNVSTSWRVKIPTG